MSSDRTDPAAWLRQRHPQPVGSGPICDEALHLISLLSTQRPATFGEAEAVVSQWRIEVGLEHGRPQAAGQHLGTVDAPGALPAPLPASSAVMQHLQHRLPGTAGLATAEISDESDHFEVVDDPQNAPAPPTQSGEIAKPVPAQLPPRRSTRYYVVTRCPLGREQLLGLWSCPWARVAKELQLPPGGLRGTGFHAKGVPTVAAGQAYWESEGWDPPMLRHA